MSLPDRVRTLVAPIAKAVAAFLTPFVILTVAAVARWAGIEVGTLDPGQVSEWVTATLLAAVGSLWVYFARNRAT